MQYRETTVLKIRKNQKREIFLRKSNIWLIGIPAGEDKENGVQAIFKDIMNKNFLELMMKDMNSQIKEALRFPDRINNKKSMPTYFKNPEDKDVIKSRY